MVEYIKKSISKIMDEVQKGDDAEFSKIVPALLKKGLDNIDLSMFNEETKVELLNKAGDELYKRGNYSEAIKAFIHTNNTAKLVKVADDYINMGMI